MQTQAMGPWDHAAPVHPTCCVGVPVAQEHQEGQLTYPAKGALNLDLKVAFNNSPPK